MEYQKNKYILIIDDNPLNLLLTKKILENQGYESITAESGVEGITIMEEHLPSLILLDIMMPEMDGFEVCRRIKNVEKWRDIPILFLTANSQTEDLIQGFEAGGVDYITKPFKSEELMVRVKNHLELSHSKKTILDMNRSRDKLYSIIAHDIRSPLSGILQTVDAIDQGYFNPCSEDFKEVIHHLRIRTKETSTLLNSLLLWTRLQDDNVSVRLIETNIFLIINSCVQLLEANASNKAINIIVDVDNNLTALCDEVSIHTVIRNLISNAVKFTPNNGEIKIYATENESDVEITVQDNGVGMSEDSIRKIFDKNEHHTSSGTDNEQGTGLGLMLVKDFVKKNKGSIKVKSKEGMGTSITVVLMKN